MMEVELIFVLILPPTSISYAVVCHFLGNNGLLKTESSVVVVVDGFLPKLFGKAYFIVKMTNLAMVWPASFDSWKVLGTCNK